MVSTVTVAQVLGHASAKPYIDGSSLLHEEQRKRIQSKERRRSRYILGKQVKEYGQMRTQLFNAKQASTWSLFNGRTYENIRVTSSGEFDTVTSLAGESDEDQAKRLSIITKLWQEGFESAITLLARHHGALATTVAMIEMNLSFDQAPEGIRYSTFYELDDKAKEVATKLDKLYQHFVRFKISEKMSELGGSAQGRENSAEMLSEELLNLAIDAKDQEDAVLRVFSEVTGRVEAFSTLLLAKHLKEYVFDFENEFYALRFARKVRDHLQGRESKLEAIAETKMLHQTDIRDAVAICAKEQGLSLKTLEDGEIQHHKQYEAMFKTCVSFNLLDVEKVRTYTLHMG